MASLEVIRKIPFFFIIGRPRSGTTLLRTMLDAHPNIIVPPEYPVILDLYNKYGRIKRWDLKQIKDFHKDFRRKQPKEFWKYEYLLVNEEALQKTLESITGEYADFTDVFKVFYYHSRSLFGEKSIHLMGDKNPIYASFTNRLFKIFPDAKFIYLTRDYRDNYRSISKFEFEAPNIALQSYRWKYASKCFVRLASGKPGQFLHLRYEDLATEPEKQLQAVCSFLEIGYSHEMLRFHEKTNDAVALVGEEDFNKFHNGLNQPIHCNNLYGWKTQLSNRQTALADAAVGGYAELMGYERKYQEPAIKNSLLVLPWKIYGNILYKAMSAAEYLPARVRRVVAHLLPYLAKAYHSISRKLNVQEKPA